MAVASILLISAPFLTMCSHDDSSEQTSTTQVAPKEVPKVPALPPEISDSPDNYIVIKPNTAAVQKLNKVGQEAKDQWFIDSVRKSGYDDSTENLLKLRDDVCSMVKNKTTFRNISDALSERGMNEQEQGTVISSSLTSKCQDGEVRIKKDLVKTPTPQSIKDQK